VSSFDELKSEMKNGFQTRGLSFWDHGSIVAARFRDLMNPMPGMTWRLPKWFVDNADFIRAQVNPNFDDICTYQQWHDCGKPFCRIVDEEGKVHYPNHASTSAQIWRSLGGNPFIGELIERDMDCHLLRPADALEYARKEHALILLVTALCELHANASMFGGIESDSFKIKFKRLDKCGATILKELTKE
jgi:hypothetical protein